MRLIDGDALEAEMDQCIFSDRDRFSTGFAKEFIDHAPTINAVLVVFCRECRHRDPEDHKCDCGAMERQGCPFPVDDDYFCKYGERKGGDE